LTGFIVCFREFVVAAATFAQGQRKTAKAIENMRARGRIRLAAQGVLLAVNGPGYAFEPTLPQIRDRLLGNAEKLGPDKKIIKRRLPAGQHATPPLAGISRIEILLVQAASECVMPTVVARHSHDVSHGSP
jgi:hypothetical protein